MYYTYILKSQKDARFYYGSTGSLEIRIKAHNSGKVR
ncbi:MAG: GIY-YIG nuclease family protein [Bacteroidia bacterium]